MYEINPTEVYYERHELLLREARDARHARLLRAARRKASPVSGMAGLGRAIALWSRTGVPFFRA
jgi:hypothetical protein